jgi:cytosine/adenosine deaminase-related metal-dependent hydrolase
MKDLSTCFIFILLAGLCQAQVYKFTNGRWFDGEKFVTETWFSDNGTLTQKTPARIDSSIDFANGFALPPFGEGHNHNVSSHNLATFRQLSNKYLKAGIFYVQNPNSLLEDRASLLQNGLINSERSIDAAFANGGLTSRDGHPTRFFEAASSKGEGNFYHSINSLADLESKWPAILAGKPDFIKAYLLFADEYDKRKNNPQFTGLRGLDEQVFNAAVKKAHAAGLRIAVHIETGYDFHVAVDAGADEILHMPGFRGDPGLGLKLPPDFENRFAIRQEDAILAAKNNTVVVTTLGDTPTIPVFYGLRRAADKLHEKNLAMLKRAHVRIALGSDAYEKNSLIEVDYLSDRHVFTNAEILVMLCQTTPQAIFPARRIGKFEEGYEVSFVVLKKDPLQNLGAIENISHWVKRGRFLDRDLR